MGWSITGTQTRTLPHSQHQAKQAQQAPLSAAGGGLHARALHACSGRWRRPENRSHPFPPLAHLQPQHAAVEVQGPLQAGAQQRHVVHALEDDAACSGLLVVVCEGRAHQGVKNDGQSRRGVITQPAAGSCWEGCMPCCELCCLPQKRLTERVHWQGRAMPFGYPKPWVAGGGGVVGTTAAAVLTAASVLLGVELPQSFAGYAAGHLGGIHARA